MNTNILRKCLAELTAENPRLDYLRGMLETLMEMQPVSTVSEVVSKGTITYTAVPVDLDEGALLDKMATAGLATIKIPDESH